MSSWGGNIPPLLSEEEIDFLLDRLFPSTVHPVLGLHRTHNQAMDLLRAEFAALQADHMEEIVTLLVGIDQPFMRNEFRYRIENLHDFDTIMPNSQRNAIEALLQIFLDQTRQDIEFSSSTRRNLFHQSSQSVHTLNVVGVPESSFEPTATPATFNVGTLESIGETNFDEHFDDDSVSKLFDALFAEPLDPMKSDAAEVREPFLGIPSEYQERLEQTAALSTTEAKKHLGSLFPSVPYKFLPILAKLFASKQWNQIVSQLQETRGKDTLPRDENGRIMEAATALLHEIDKLKDAQKKNEKRPEKKHKASYRKGRKKHACIYCGQVKVKGRETNAVQAHACPNEQRIDGIIHEKYYCTGRYDGKNRRFDRVDTMWRHDCRNQPTQTPFEDSDTDNSNEGDEEEEKKKRKSVVPMRNNDDETSERMHDKKDDTDDENDNYKGDGDDEYADVQRFAV
jgi:hypothetical protein